MAPSIWFQKTAEKNIVINMIIQVNYMLHENKTIQHKRIFTALKQQN